MRIRMLAALAALGCGVAAVIVVVVLAHHTLG